jgi:predicted Zn-dependent peptidase
MLHDRLAAAARHVCLALATTALGASIASSERPSSVGRTIVEPLRERLDNGVTVLMLPIRGVGQVAIQSFYEVGFVHDPDGMPQAAHLLEHLVCNAGTPSHEPGASMARLSAMGMANAETMPDWTHYDYVVPAAELDFAFAVEAERLEGLRIDEAIVRQEDPRCCREVEFVERNAQSGNLKFGCMALNQAWRFGQTEVKVRSGLDYDPEAMEHLRRSVQRPDRLTLVLIGDFDPDAAMDLVRRRLGGIENPDVQPPAPFDWSKAPRRSIVRWDSQPRVVCVAFPPPGDAQTRRVLSLWGSSLAQRLRSDAALGELTTMVFAPNHMWMVGELPMFVYAAVKPGAPLEQVEALLIERIEALIETGGGAAPAELAAYARGLAATTQGFIRDEASVRQAARALEGQGRSAERAMGLVLGQGALNWGSASRFLGPEPGAAIAALEAMTPEDLAATLREHLRARDRIVTILLPEDEPAPGGA